MPPYSFATLLLQLVCTTTTAAASDLLYVSSYAGTITTLSIASISNHSSSSNASKYHIMQTVNTTRGCGESPSWLTLDPAGGILYCLDEGLSSPDKGSLSSFRTGSKGSLSRLDKVATVGGPVHGVFYGDEGHGLAVAHYGGSALSTWDVSDPAKMRSLDTMRFRGDEGLGPKPEQKAPHPHEAVVDPTGRFLVVPDLGADLVRLFRIGGGNSTLGLTALPSVRVKAGSGPRHVVFAVVGGSNCGGSDDKKTFMYLITELASTIIGYDVSYDGDDEGIQLNEIYDIGVHGEGKSVSSKAAAAEVILSPDQRFLIASSRRENNHKMSSFQDGGGSYSSSSSSSCSSCDSDKQIDSDSLINFSIDAATGRLTLLQDIPAGGRFPRQFSMNRAGTRVAVGLQHDSRVVVLARDATTGRLGGFEGVAHVKGEITSVIFAE